MLIGGLVTSVLYEVLFHKIVATCDHEHHNVNTILCGGCFEAHVRAIFSNFLFDIRFVFFCLAPLANDLALMRLVMGIDAVVLVAAWAQMLFFLPVPIQGPTVEVVCFWCNAMWALFFVFGVLAAMLCKEAMEMQRKMWNTLTLWFSLQLPFSIVRAIAHSVEQRAFSTTCWSAIFQAGMLLLLARPGWRQRVQASLNQAFLAHSANRAAAGIAGLVGDCSVREVSTQAAGRFRRIDISEVTFEDLATNTPDVNLFRRSSPAKLRHCDAFVTHSWKDDAPAKWEAMQRWRENFVEKNGREPRIWMDKMCIDQNNIEADLRCLPVFLCGCRTLLVLCGTSYLSRLWCIMELFTFVHMGGNSDDIEFVPVFRRNAVASDMKEIQNGFATFDAKNCTCFHAKDKDRMLGIIHAAFGHFDGFNAAVRNIFDNAGWHDLADGIPGVDMRGSLTGKFQRDRSISKSFGLDDDSDCDVDSEGSEFESPTSTGALSRG